MRRAPAPAKLNLALVVGPRKPDGKHELCTVYQRIDLCDRISLELGGIASRAEAAAALERIGREVSVRAEELSPPDFVALVDALP